VLQVVRGSEHSEGNIEILSYESGNGESLELPTPLVWLLRYTLGNCEPRYRSCNRNEGDIGSHSWRSKENEQHQNVPYHQQQR